MSRPRPRAVPPPAPRAAAAPSAVPDARTAARAPARDEPAVEIEGRRVPVAVRVNARARRMTLRMAPGPLPEGAEGAGGGGLCLTLPPGVELAEGLAFVERSRDWIAQRLRRLPEPIPLAAGTRIPVLGEELLIQHAPWSRRPPWRERPGAEGKGGAEGKAGEGGKGGEGGILWVGGAAEHLPRRVGDHLKAEARREIAARARAKAAALPTLAPRDHRRLGRITLRDTRSRWGSCSHRGDLNFSWRLVFAPLAVLDYVVAHEVAHLAHLDHSPAFWRLCDALSEEPGWTKAWLKRHGAGLLRYG